MWDFIVSTVPVVTTFAVGGIGWGATHFVGAPLLGLRQLRRKIHVALFFTANISHRETDPGRYDQAVDELRRLAAELNALHHSATKVLKHYAGWMGYDLPRAVDGLTGLSNSLYDKEGRKAGFRFDVEDALDLPRSYSERPETRD